MAPCASELPWRYLSYIQVCKQFQMVPLLSGLSDTIGLNVVELGSKTVSTSDDFFFYKGKFFY